MKRLFLVFAASFVVFTSAYAWAGATPEETRLNDEAAALDKNTAEPRGEKAVVERLENEFKVDEARIKGMREEKLGYGEIAITLSLAEKMPGGITDENINKILSMRRGHGEGWGEIANNLGVKLGPVVSNVEKVKAEAHKGHHDEKSEKIKEEKAEKKAEKGERHEALEKHERHERHEGHERLERPDRPERIERAERVERVERPEKGGRR